MGGRGGSSGVTRNGSGFSSVQAAMLAADREGLFSSYVSFMTYDWKDPNDTGTPAVDQKAADAIYDVIHDIATKMPEVKGMVHSLSVVSGIPDNTYAQCYMMRGDVEINPKKFKDYDKLQYGYANDVRSGFHTAGTDARSIIAHEIGHAIDGYLSYRENLYGYTPKGNVKFVSSVMRSKVMKAAGYKVSDIGKTVSRYATTDSQEWFAECFAEYTCSKNPRPVAKEFGRQLTQLLKQVRKK